MPHKNSTSSSVMHTLWLIWTMNALTIDKDDYGLLLDYRVKGQTEVLINMIAGVV